MRSQQEIVDKINADASPFAFVQEVLVPYLEFAFAKQFLTPGVTAEEFGNPNPNTEEHILGEMRNYANFGWDKISGHRGLSAVRTIEKMLTWLWLLNKDNLIEEVNSVAYAQYGAPKLALICASLGFDIPPDPEIANMIVGRPCRQECEEGCSV